MDTLIQAARVVQKADDDDTWVDYYVHRFLTETPQAATRHLMQYHPHLLRRIQRQHCWTMVDYSQRFFKRLSDLFDTNPRMAGIVCNTVNPYIPFTQAPPKGPFLYAFSWPELVHIYYTYGPFVQFAMVFMALPT